MAVYATFPIQAAHHGDHLQAAACLVAPRLLCADDPKSEKESESDAAVT
jgi:hypothetical protein